MLGTVLAGARTFILVPLFFVYTLMLAIAVIVAGWIKPASRLHDSILNHWSRMFLGIPPVTFEVTGLENVDPDRRYVIASNHLSIFDIPLLFEVLPLRGRFLSKKEVFKVPIVGIAMKSVGIVKIDRQAGRSSRQAINDGVQIAAERGYSLIVFPEGTRSRAGTLLPFKKGAFRIAIDNGLPLLPVTIEGTERINPPASKVFRRGHVTVRVLPSIETADLTNKDHLSGLTRDVEASVNAEYAEMQSLLKDSV